MTIALFTLRFEENLAFECRRTERFERLLAGRTPAEGEAEVARTVAARVELRSVQEPPQLHSMSLS